MRRPWWRRFWLAFLAAYRLDLRAVCLASERLSGRDDYHHWTDSTVEAPWSGFVHRCKRCNKGFTI